MVSHLLKVFSVFTFLLIALDQAGAGGNAVAELSQIEDVLRHAQISGSLAFSGCGFHQRVPDDLPAMRFTSDYSGPPEETLAWIFAPDSRMRVTEDSWGLVRMMETDVPTDLLNFRIHHLKFYGSGQESEDEPVHGPRTAIMAIMQNPEVKAFRRKHNIEPNSDLLQLPGDALSGRIVFGQLDDVTVSEALDYILKTFPGFWIYESCVDKEGKRSDNINHFGLR